MDFSATHTPTAYWQDVANEAGAHTVDRHCRPPIPVTVRLEWERDGEEWIESVALGWSGRLVKVEMRDRRWYANAIWLHASEVRRRETQ